MRFWGLDSRGSRSYHALARLFFTASTTMVTTTLATAVREIDERMLTEIECILHSETFRSSDVLRRLLRFLADKTLSGKGEGLKEYTVAIEALQKPPTYDPKHDSTVRIQVSRLRQKLGEYFQGEGKDDPVIVTLPRGHFKLVFEIRQIIPQEIPAPAKTRVEPLLIWLAVLMCVTLLVAVGWGTYSTMKLRRIEAEQLAPAIQNGRIPAWTPELQSLWQPFVANGRPLILAVEDPLFMRLGVGGGVFYRDTSVNESDKLMDTPGAVGLRKLLHNPEAVSGRYYTTLGEASTAFLVGEFLATRQPNISMIGTSQLRWQELADNNVLFIGKQSFFYEQVLGMPIRPQLLEVANGVEDLSPNHGEPKLFLDRYSTGPTEGSEAYVLVTHLPGPLGDSDIESFVSNRSAGYIGAVRWFTDPRSALTLVTKLRKPSGELPRYYQVLLRVKFKDNVPTETSYVLSRELR
jgi:hypothetical protein